MGALTPLMSRAEYILMLCLLIVAGGIALAAQWWALNLTP